MRIMEPVPAIDTFLESDWRMKSETIDDAKTVRVLAGYESLQGELDPEKSRAYWFDENGRLLRVFLSGMDIRRSGFEEFDAAQVARQIRVLYHGSLAVIIKVTDLSTTGDFSGANFEIAENKWNRAFTDEVR
jgi:hypothetical protein